MTFSFTTHKDFCVWYVVQSRMWAAKRWLVHPPNWDTTCSSVGDILRSITLWDFLNTQKFSIATLTYALTWPVTRALVHTRRTKRSFWTRRSHWQHCVSIVSSHSWQSAAVQKSKPSHWSWYQFTDVRDGLVGHVCIENVYCESGPWPTEWTDVARVNIDWVHDMKSTFNECNVKF